MKRCIYSVATAMILAIAVSPAAQAEPHCTPTAHVAATHYPGAAAIPTSNNLLLPSGKATPVEGQRLIITGHLLDSRCIPVPEAIVELWQADPFGHWYLATDEDRVNPRPTFAGAGRTVTNVNGEFTFITAFPGATSAKTRKDPNAIEAPHVNIRIKADNFTPVTTVLYFENDRRNAADAGYGKLTPDQRNGSTLTISEGDNGDLNGAVQFVLPGKTPYRTY